MVLIKECQLSNSCVHSFPVGKPKFDIPPKFSLNLT